MPSPFFRDTSFAKAAPTGGAGIGSGTKELSYAGLSAGAETGIGAANGSPLSGTEVANAAAAKASAEASALSAQAFAKTTAATVGVGHAAIGKVSIGNSMLSQPAIGNAAVGQSAAGQAAVGNAAVGQAAVGQAAVGHAAIAPAAVGHAAIAQAAVGNAAIAQAALAAAAEPISPLVQLIMRLPGATGMAHSFFEWLANMFMPGGHDLMSTLSPHIMHMELAGHVATLHHVTGLVPSMGEHLTSGLTSLNGLPLDAPILQGMQHSGALSGLDSGFGSFNGQGLSEHFAQNPANIGAGPDYAHAQFEQAASGSRDSGLAGPSMSGSGSAGGSYLAGNQRLFSDNMSGGGQFNSITSNTSVPSTSGAVPNAVTSIGQDMNQMSAQAPVPSTPTAPSSAGVPSSDSQQFGPSAFGQKYGGDNLVASDSQVYRPTTGNYYQGASGSGGSDVTPLKAKQLTFEDIHKGVVGDHGKKLIDQIAGKKSPDLQMPPSYKPTEVPTAPAAPPQHIAAAPHPHVAAEHAAKPHAVDTVAHRGALPKAYATAAHHEAVPHHAHHTTHKHTEIAQAPKQEAAPPADNQNAGTDQPAAGQPAGSDQTAAAPAQATDYEVVKGDSLWNIAKDKLGDGNRWSEIYKLNNDVLGQNPDLIFSGTHLRLPGADSLVADAAKYTVKSGDCLWNIAKNHLGSAAKWSDIYKANMNVIGANPSLIQPGQQLSLGGNIAQMPAANNMAALPQSQAAGTGDMMGGQQASMPSDGGSVSGFNPQALSAPQQPSMPVSENVIKVVPQHDLPDGPGAAGAATLKPAANSLVSNSLAPDLSGLIDQRR